MNETQRKAMLFIINWIKEKNTPVPRAKLITHMEKSGVSKFTTDGIIKSLIKKQYIRRGTVVNRSVCYIQLRSL